MRSVCLVGVFALSVVCGVLRAGPLEPPGAPVASTMKTIDQVEPRIPLSAETAPGDSTSIYRITSPGSYYLTEDLIGVVNKHGIVIDAPRVSIDLNGFAIVGPSGPRQGAFDGIRSVVVMRGCSIRNGSVRDWSGSGVNVPQVSQSNSDAILVTDVAAISNTGRGIGVTANSTIIRGCSAAFNGQDGIRATQSIVTDCVTFRNDGAAIAIEASDCRVEGNLCHKSDNGIRVTGSGNVITGNKCSGNTVNWVIFGGNFYGPIINRAGVATASVVVDAAAGTLGTTDPHANFTH